MMKTGDDYYVYVYIDPRNNEEFYYGKGRGNRKRAHLLAKDESAKVRRIKEIKKEDEKPKIKVVAADLAEEQALIVESTLLWKLGKDLTNATSGVFASKFRPHNTLHKDLPGFDFDYGVYLVNVGEGPHRCWSDSRRYGFLSAGQRKYASEQLEGLQSGDVVVAYLNKHGYVGIGTVETPPVRVRDFRWKGKPLSRCRLQQPNIYDNSDDVDRSECLVAVRWSTTVDAESARWKPKAGLFTTRRVRASLANQTKTLKFLESEFGVGFKDLIKE
jgi:hypothetical protein